MKTIKSHLNRIIFPLCLGSTLIAVSSCTQFVELDPSEQVSDTQVITDISDSENSDTMTQSEESTDTNTNIDLTGTATQTQTSTQSQTQTQTESQTSTQSQTQTESDTQTQTESDTQTQSDTQTDTQTDLVNENYLSIPLSSSITRVQPMTGVVFWTTNQNALSQLGDIVQLEFTYLVYSDVVSQEGVYDWSEFDELLDEVEQRGHQLVLRFRYTYPGVSAISVPDYIVNQQGYNLTYANVEGQNTFLPDWGFAELENFTLEFFNEFSDRYDGDPRIAMLQVGFGSYSEYHLWDGPLSLGENFPSKSFQTQFLNNMDEKFATTQWSISIDAASSQYSPFAAQDNLLDLNFGVFDDSFMHENHSNSNNEYNRASWLFFEDDRYENNMQGGEFNYYSTYDQQNVLKPVTGPWGTDFETFSQQYNITYIIGNDQFEYQSESRIEQASLAMGYAFHVEVYEASDIQTRVVISNKGVAPLYYDAFPAVDGVRSEQSLKGLLPNESREFIINSGGENPKLTIQSDYLVEGQVIEFSAFL